MKIKQENIISRFNEMLSMCNLTKRQFCEHIGIGEKIFYRFIRNNFVKIKHLNKIDELGISTRWLFLGKGNQFNETENGIKLKKYFDTYKVDEKLNKVYKLKYWITTHYSSIENFELMFNLKEKRYFEQMERDVSIPAELINLLFSEGLNTKWLYHNNVCPYHTGFAGREKKSWLIKNCKKDNLIYKAIKG